MENEEKREQVIQGIADLLRHQNFSFEFKVAKRPNGIRVIAEVTQEELNNMIENASKK